MMRHGIPRSLAQVAKTTETSQTEHQTERERNQMKYKLTKCRSKAEWCTTKQTTKICQRLDRNNLRTGQTGRLMRDSKQAHQTS